MAGTELSLSAEYDLPREIVWDALVDPDLVIGWLAEASIDFREGGAYDLTWIGPTYLPPTHGEITRIDDLERIAISTSNVGDIVFTLEDIPGVTRALGSRVTVVIRTPVERRFTPNVVAHWRTNLEQLADLLRGHPVNWATWELDRGAAWNAHFDEATRVLSR